MKFSASFSISLFFFQQASTSARDLPCFFTIFKAFQHAPTHIREFSQGSTRFNATTPRVDPQRSAIYIEIPTMPRHCALHRDSVRFHQPQRASARFNSFSRASWRFHALPSATAFFSKAPQVPPAFIRVFTSPSYHKFPRLVTSFHKFSRFNEVSARLLDPPPVSSGFLLYLRAPNGTLRLHEFLAASS